ncbi:hypothetical protein EIM50_17110 [Pseudoxanthomonas sp. SGD-10]|nr:hypothetical protein EIM50_17110 [Pseudoxanthomonas sp. SGD-10]
MKSSFDIKDIIRFVDGEMDSGEREAFELALERDEELRQEYELYLEVNGTLKAKFGADKADVEFRERLTEFNKVYFGKEEHTRIRKLNVNKFIYAAAVILLALFIWAPWNKDLYEDYAEIKMVSVAERGTSGNDNLLLEATEAFNAKDYLTAKDKLGTLLTQDENNHMLKFYYGITLLETDEIANSRAHLEEVYKGESIFKDDAAFYLALSYVKEKDNDKAREWLEKISPDAAVFKKAEELKSKL